MKYIPIIILFLCIIPNKGVCQKFDSTHVYAIDMSITYGIGITKATINTEVDPIVITNPDSTMRVYHLLKDSIQGKFIEEINDRIQDIRLSFEFYNNGILTKTIGIISHPYMFDDNRLYLCRNEKLILLDSLIPGLSKITRVSHLLPK